MSSIKTTQIDGDVSVGRNVAIGGKASVSGSTTIGHNLTVEGWLEAKNIKGVNKGVFTTVTKLREAYPTPHDGWFAGVGTSSPFTAYVGDGGEWVATGGTITIDVDMTQYTEEVEQLSEDIAGVKSDIEDLQDDVQEINDALGAADGIATLDENGKLDSDQVPSNLATTTQLAEVSDAASAAAQGVETLTGKLGAANGIATLDSSGKLTSGQIPLDVARLDINGKLQSSQVPSNVPTLTDGKLPSSVIPDSVTTDLELETALADYAHKNGDDDEAFAASEIHIGDDSANAIKLKRTGNEDSEVLEIEAVNDGDEVRKVIVPIPSVADDESDPLTLATTRDIEDEIEDFSKTLPAQYNDTIEFSGVLDSATIVSGTSTKKSTDSDAQVFYVTALKQFVLGVRTDVLYSSIFAVNAPMLAPAIGEPAVVSRLTDAQIKEAIAMAGFPTLYEFYLDWADRDLYSNSSYVPLTGKSFICTSTDVLYYWKSSVPTLQPMGKDFTEEIQDVADDLSELSGTVTELATTHTNDMTSVNNNIAPRLFFNGNELLNRAGQNTSLETFLSNTTSSDYAYIRKQGVVITLRTVKGLKSYQWKGSTWSDPDDWKDFGGSATVGNCYNVTNEASDLLPAGTGYFTLQTAINAALTKGVAGVGMQLTFALDAGVWKTYQYIGANVEQANFTDTTKWVDMAGMSAGSEPVININALCGAPPSGGYYTLSSAREALVTKGSATGIEYRKSGLVITYMSGENEWETKQFVGIVESFSTEGDWKDFGANDDEVEIVGSDTPESGGEDAFTTGGAYNHLAKGIAALTPEEIEEISGADTSEYNYYRLVNEGGNKIGEAFALPKGGGTGDVKSTTIAFKHNPIAQAMGGEFLIEAAIMSVKGNVEYNTRTVTISDNTTHQVLLTKNFDMHSSSATDYCFVIDVSSLFKQAGTRYLRVTATDDEGTQFSRIITVKSIDATVVTTDSLASLNILTTETDKVLALYQFPNNQSGAIDVNIDIYANGAWRDLHNALVRDSSFHAITVNTTLQDNTVLTHGSYLMRIQGTDRESGVSGNTVYTSLMVIDPESTVPVVSLRYNDESGNGTIKQYETIGFDIAAYKNGSQSVEVTLNKNGVAVNTLSVTQGRTYHVTQQIQETGTAANPTSLVFQAVSGLSVSASVTVQVVGSAIDAAIYDGALYAFDFASRSNQESDHTIANNGYTLAVNGANWDSNGFVSYLGTTALRIAENVTASLNHTPFNDNTIEENGMGIQFAFAARHIADDTTMLMRCYNPSSGAGFYVSGSKIGIFCNSGTPQRIERGYRTGEKVTVGIVVEKAANGVSRDGTDYGLMKLYINGEEAGCLGYVPNNGNLIQNANITFDGTQGDFYLYWLMAWNNSLGIDWMQSFKNYLVKLTDTDSMITEYDFENVYPGSTVDGPNAEELYSRGMPYLIEAPFRGSLSTLDNTTETGDKDVRIVLYYYDPRRPWRNFVAYCVQRRNQGTTSAQRPVKNARYYLAKKKGKTKAGEDITYTINGVQRTNTYIELLETRSSIVERFGETGGLLWDEASKLAANNKVRVGEDTIPVDVITVKVDYSDSSNANDCAACNLMNATYRALGNDFLTPAQRYYDGTYDIGSGSNAVHLEGLRLNHSTANHPIAMFRSDVQSGSNPYFHAKGNWKEDKGEQVALGFKNTPGYNLGCVNYGDFVEYYGKSAAMLAAEGQTGRTTHETLNEIETRFLADQNKDTSKKYLLSQYCGSSYKFYSYVGGSWTDTTGSMSQQIIDGEKVWVVSGDVLNPVEGFELLEYQGLCWWQGISSVSDMMQLSSSKSKWVMKLLGTDDSVTAPIWTKYFECMVDDDDLALAYAQGKKVPYFLYRLLCWLNSCDYASVTGWETIWRNNGYKYFNPKSLMAYYLFTDYLGAVDQQAKNMQPMFFLDDGGSVTNGVYNNEQYMRMYPNKVYDADTLVGKDNIGSDTIDPETDPTLLDPSNPYMGYGSVLWQDIARQPEMKIDASDTVTLNAVAGMMRSRTTTVDGVSFVPFSPEGCEYFFMDKIVKMWQKTVSSYDGERKFISFTATADSIYFYALHGLRLTAIPAFIEKRFAYRDGNYRTGDFTSVYAGGRIGAVDNASISFTVAKDGFFAYGNDAPGNITASEYLAANTVKVFNLGTNVNGKELYVYQVHRMKSLDLSGISLGEAWSFGNCELLESLALGSASHTELPITVGNRLTSLSLGELPFLKTLDIRNTSITSVNASGCPRIEEVLAAGTSLTTLVLAQTSPIDTLTLPATMSALRFVNLPNLGYPASGGSGLTLSGTAAVETLHIEGSPNINGCTLLKAVLVSQSSVAKLTTLRIARQTMKGDGTDLALLITRTGVHGMDDAGGTMAKPVIDGNYELTKLYESSDIEEWEDAIYGLTVVTVIDAYITLINEVNGDEDYGGTSEVDTVTLANVDELALNYYNGEQYSDYQGRYAADNADINDIVTS